MIISQCCTIAWYKDLLHHTAVNPRFLSNRLLFPHCVKDLLFPCNIFKNLRDVLGVSQRALLVFVPKNTLLRKLDIVDRRKLVSDCFLTESIRGADFDFC